MNNKRIINAIEFWQRDYRFHPLTCENHSNVKLFPAEDELGVYLYCPHEGCNYIQRHIPDVIMTVYNAKENDCLI